MTDGLRINDLEAQNLYSSVPTFYDFLQNRILVTFKPRYEDPTGKMADFELVLSKKMTYDVVRIIFDGMVCVLNCRWRTASETSSNTNLSNSASLQPTNNLRLPKLLSNAL